MENNWNQIFRARTKKLAVDIIKFCGNLKKKR